MQEIWSVYAVCLYFWIVINFEHLIDNIITFFT